METIIKKRCQLELEKNKLELELEKLKIEEEDIKNGLTYSVNFISDEFVTIGNFIKIPQLDGSVLTIEYNGKSAGGGGCSGAEVLAILKGNSSNCSLYLDIHSKPIKFLGTGLLIGKQICNCYEWHADNRGYCLMLDGVNAKCGEILEGYVCGFKLGASHPADEEDINGNQVSTAGPLFKGTRY
jgi:hypothetical protein